MFTVPITGSGTTADPYMPSLPMEKVVSWADNGDGTADVELTDEAFEKLRVFSGLAADALNGGTSWSNAKAIRPSTLPVALVKQDLVQTVKIKYSEFSSTIPAGTIVAHDNNSVRGVWEAQVDTTAEPTKSSSDWSLIFSV